MSEATVPPGLDRMDLQVLLPTGVLVDVPVGKVVAEADDGYFCLEPRHVDFVAALVPGVLTFVTAEGRERFVAVDRGLLVKCGQSVFVATPNGVTGDTLETLRDLVEERFLAIDEAARKARSALARLEAGALRGIRQLEEHSRG